MGGGDDEGASVPVTKLSRDPGGENWNRVSVMRAVGEDDISLTLYLQTLN